MSARLSHQLRLACLAIVHRFQSANTKRFIQLSTIGSKATLFGMGLGGEFAGGFYAFNRILGPLPGEPNDPLILVMAGSSVIAAATFHIYCSQFSNSRLKQFVNRSAGFFALLFVIFMGLSLSQSIFENTHEVQTIGDLFAEESAPVEASWLEQFFSWSSAGFAFAAGSLAICNFFLMQILAVSLRQSIEHITERRRLARTSQALMAEIESCDREIISLETERVALAKELTPSAAVSFAHEVVSVIRDALEPSLQRLNDLKLRVKDTPNPYVLTEGPQIDTKEFEKRLLGLLDIDARAVHSAFESDIRSKS